MVGARDICSDYAGVVFKNIFRQTPCLMPADIADCVRKFEVLNPVITGSPHGKQQHEPMFDWQENWNFLQHTRNEEISPV